MWKYTDRDLRLGKGADEAAVAMLVNEALREGTNLRTMQLVCWKEGEIKKKTKSYIV